MSLCPIDAERMVDAVSALANLSMQLHTLINIWPQRPEFLLFFETGPQATVQAGLEFMV